MRGRHRPVLQRGAVSCSDRSRHARQPGRRSRAALTSSTPCAALASPATPSPGAAVTDAAPGARQSAGRKRRDRRDRLPGEPAGAAELPRRLHQSAHRIRLDRPKVKEARRSWAAATRGYGAENNLGDSPIAAADVAADSPTKVVWSGYRGRRQRVCRPHDRQRPAGQLARARRVRRRTRAGQPLVQPVGSDGGLRRGPPRRRGAHRVASRDRTSSSGGQRRLQHLQRRKREPVLPEAEQRGVDGHPRSGRSSTCSRPA